MAGCDVRFDQPPVVEIVRSEYGSAPAGRWPTTIPAVAQLLTHGLRLARGVTFLVGENGSGKSTLVEGIAGAYGLGPEGGTTHSRHQTHPTESGLASWLRVVRGVGASHWGFFLRAETMHGYYTYLETEGATDRTPRYHEMSHGESFLTVVEHNLDSAGFFCLDEPEAALSFTSVLSLMVVLNEVARAGGQVVCATHSPVLAALPGATIVEVGDWGLRTVEWADLELVQSWRGFLDEPGRFLAQLGLERT